jgi:microsomal dipeptidase-like Zn-dependent dipeptidase
MSKQVLIDGLQISNWDRPTLEETRAGGVSAVNATCAVWEGALQTVRNISDWYVMERDNSDLVSIATTVEEILSLAQQERLAVLLGFQNASPFEQDYTLVEVFHRLGVRIAQLTYNIQNHVGGSCYEPQDSGLTRFGHRIVEEMNRVGMLVDLSHVGERTSLDAVAASSRPVAITHANPRWFSDTPRNKSDEVIAAVTDRGGIIGVCFYPNVIGGKETTLEAFCGMVVRLIDQVGVDHVAIGSDAARNWGPHHVEYLRDGRWKPREEAHWPEWPSWFTSPQDFPNVLAGLADAGLVESEIDAIAGGNWLRLFGQVFEAADPHRGSS